MRRKIKLRLKFYFKIAEHAFALVGVFMILYCSLFDVSVIVSDSMSPTLKGTSRENGDWILTEKITYLFRSPRRWELISFQGQFGNQVMKRVVGLPNEKISLHDFKPFINSKKIDIPSTLNFLKYYDFGNLHRHHKFFDCKDGYYVLGDNSRDSDDSRYNGTIKPSEITGRPFLRIWPIARIGFLNP